MMNLVTDFLQNDINKTDVLSLRTAYDEVREKRLISRMRDLEYQMKALEDFISNYWYDSEVPDVYEKLVYFLNKKFEKIDDLFLDIDMLSYKDGNMVLDEIEMILDILEKRISVVVNFMHSGGDELVAC